MDNIFDIEPVESEAPKLTEEDFIAKTKRMLNEIYAEYSQCWISKQIEEAEAGLAPCEGCKGSGCFKMGDVEIECVMDRENGDCYKRVFDDESFLEFMEQRILFGERPFFELMHCEIVSNQLKPSNDAERG